MSQSSCFCSPFYRFVGAVPRGMIVGAATVACAMLAPLTVVGQDALRPSSAPQANVGPVAASASPGAASASPGAASASPGAASERGMAMAYLARNTARPASTAVPPPVVAAPVALPAVPRVAQRSKPFSAEVGRGSTISPYLALDAPTTDSSLTNYYLFVRPQLEQQARARVQQAQYQRVQSDVPRRHGLGASQGVERAGDYTNRFMNSGSYYPGQR